MKLFRKFTVLIFLAWSIPAISDITPMPAAKMEGDLGLIIVASDSPGYIEEWLSTAPSHGVTIKRLRTAKPEQLIVAAFLVTGVSGNEKGLYEFSVSFYILGPDQKPIFGQRDYAKGQGQLPEKPMLIMADPAFDLVFENSDPEGIYTIVAQVQDLVSGKKSDNAYKIKFIKSEL